ncbi:glycosyltransferase involved in LPS biosynthesis [Actinobacillus pleuropneumoniae serovar 3 str. JL03]|uniref:Glycosyltransferase involved in LPS biosynthesis n=1 Tax=Actinobacillus pleuropneumoniae serotype 3 (strain JL03) TaxID=434271 RepID=B0BPW7_ACTPJ|nr:glycosyltransferase family 25 protein [Actinobacillus pleuropneumoniae]ABY69602.1 glycosyltransferase involved in LPS biosynthesis [Actinobacillus pleuropneumoniae serovar 3 str. JL03]
MKKFLISLDKDAQRRELFFSQADTADFTVFSAINTMNVEQSELEQRFDFAKFEQRYGRKVTKGEIGCTMSHLGVYELIVNDESINEDDYALVCEDDCLFAANFQQNLTALLNEKLNADIVLVGQSKILSFDDTELAINYPATFRFLQKKIGETEYRYAYPYKNYFAGTVAYLIKKSTARKFLAQKATELPFWLADDYILFGQQFAINTLVVRPLMAIENPNLVSNLENLRGSLSNNMFKKVLKFPLKKLLAIKRNL